MNEPRSMNVRLHMARRLSGSAIDRRRSRDDAWCASQRIRKRIEEVFGWLKTIGGMRRPMRRGIERVHLRGRRPKPGETAQLLTAAA